MWFGIVAELMPTTEERSMEKPQKCEPISTKSDESAVWPEEERYCSKHALFQIHPTTMGPLDERMTWERLDSSRDAALAEDQRTENILRERTSIPEDLLAARRVRDVYITPEDALKFGIVHRVAEFSLPQGNEIVQI